MKNNPKSSDRTTKQKTNTKQIKATRNRQTQRNNANENQRSQASNTDKKWGWGKYRKILPFFNGIRNSN